MTTLESIEILVCIICMFATGYFCRDLQAILKEDYDEEYDEDYDEDYE